MFGSGDEIKSIVASAAIMRGVKALVEKFELDEKKATELFQKEFALGIKSGFELFGQSTKGLDELIKKGKK